MPPGPPPPALYDIDDECRLGGAVFLLEGVQLQRGDFELMGIDVPPERSTRQRESDPPAEKHFLLTFALRHWDEDIILVAMLRGQLVRLEALLGGRLAHDTLGSAFDDAIAEEEGLRARSSEAGLMMRIRGDEMAEGERDIGWRDRYGRRPDSIFTGNGRRGLSRGNGPEESQTRAEVAIRLTSGWAREEDRTLRIAGRGVVDYVESVRCHRIKPPSPPPDQRFRPSPPPPPPDAPN